jgi:hypothetical protein
MSTLKATTIEPATGTNVTLGTTGDTVALPGNTLVLDTWKDSGGNTLFTSNGSGVVSSVNSAFTGAGPVLIQSQTASGDSSISFTSGIDSTYDKYMFVCTNINPATDNTDFVFLGSSNTGSSYGVDKTTTSWRAKHTEAGSHSFGYLTGYDHPPDGTEKQWLAYGIGNASDESASGIFYIFAPSSTTYVKQFYSRFQWYGASIESTDLYIAGYWNTTSVIDAVQFKMISGNFDGKISLYGVK